MHIYTHACSLNLFKYDNDSSYHTPVQREPDYGPDKVVFFTFNFN